MHRSRLVIILFIGTLSLACGTSPSSPTRNVVVTFAVAGEHFRVLLTDEAQIAAARAAQAGGAARVPNGRIAAGAQVNVGWSWHLEDVTFAPVTIKLCDGRPSDVERDGVTFGGGRYCPWTAVIVAIEPR